MAWTASWCVSVYLLPVHAKGLNPYPSCHALGCLDSAVSGISGPFVAVLLEKVPNQREKTPEGDVGSELNLAMPLPIISAWCFCTAHPCI